MSSALLEFGTRRGSAPAAAVTARANATIDAVPTAPPSISIDDTSPLPRAPQWRGWQFRPLPPWSDLLPISTLVPPYGPAGAGTFVVSLQSGATVTLEFATDVLKTWTGLEYRASLLSQPRQTYKATALLAGGHTRDVRSQLIAGAATGAPFLLALSYEEATCLAAAIGGTVTVASTAVLDWAQPGQRVILLGGDDTSTQASVQSVTSTTLTLGDAITGAPITLTGESAQPGARLLPLVPVFIDPSQSFVRYPVTLEEWQLVARAAAFGFVGSDTFGAGATVTTYADATWGTTPVWDRGINATSTVTDSVQTLADLIDLGGVPGNVGSAVAVDIGRQVSIASDTIADWQWLKAFLGAVLGRQKRFLLSTSRPDLVMSSNPGSSLLIVFTGTSYGDPTQYADAAHQRLAITKTDGSVQYVAITGISQNFDGTDTLSLDQTVTGTVAMISFFETCRFEADSMDVTWTDTTFSFTAMARVVQQ